MNSANLRNQIREELSSLSLRRVPTRYSREAAVLILIFEQDGEPCFLLTLRTDEVETHKGQISFPGGMRDGSEPLVATALRETFEEVGIEESRIEVLGQFHEYLSHTGYCVTPFVGFLSTPFTTVPQPREVAEVLHVTLRVFLDAGRLRVERRLRMGKTMEVYFYSYERHQIWGLTAGMIKDFLEQVPLTF